MKHKKKSRGSKSDANVMTLCGVCARDYYNSPDFYIKAIHPLTIKEQCTKCDRGGYDYRITPKRRKEGR